MLKKREGFRAAYDGFVVDKVARYGVRQRARLLADAGIIRNRLKVDYAIENAKRIVALRRDYGSFGGWIDAHHPLGKDEWVRSDEHTSELQSLMRISYSVFCFKKK